MTDKLIYFWGNNIEEHYKYKSFFFNAIYSPDDLGWYAEIWNENGETLHQTKIVSTEDKTINLAMKWVEKNEIR